MGHFHFPFKIRQLWLGSLFARHWWIVPILVVAVLIRWNGMTKSVWQDEVQSLITITQQLETKPYFTSHQVFHISRMLMATGSIMLIRLPYLLIGLGTILGGWWLGRLWHHWLLSVLLALTFTLWPFQAYWDTQIRYYAIVLCLGIGTIIAWEAYRLRPTYRRYLIGLIVTFLASLTHTLSIIILAMPAFYLAHDQLRRLPKAFRRSGGGWRARLWAIARISSQGLLLAWVGLCAVQFSCGPDFIVKQIRTTLGPLQSGPVHEQAPATLTANGLKGERRLGNEAEAKISLNERMRVPVWADATLFVQNAFKEAFTPGHWSSPALLGLSNQQRIFNQLVGYNGQQFTKADIHAFILAGLVLGSIALLFISPPLLLSAWFLILCTGLLINLNASLHFNDTRYYTLPALVGVVLITAGLASAVNLLRWPLHRWRPRLSAYAVLLLALVGGAWFTVRAFPAARYSADYCREDWQKFYQESTRKFPQGALFTGIGSKGLLFYNRLAMHGYDTQASADYWRSPRRNTIIDGYWNRNMRDLALLDVVNAHEGLVFFNYEGWRYPFFPFEEYRYAIPSPSVSGFTGLRVSLISLDKRIYITRGHASVPLMPRLKAAPSGKDPREEIYRIDSLFEVPGEYELSVTQTATAQPLALMLNGQRLPLTKRKLALSTTKPTAKSLPPQTAEAPQPNAAPAPTETELSAPLNPVPESDRDAAFEDPISAALDRQPPLPLDLGPEWQAPSGRPIPIDLKPQYEYVTKIQAPFEVMRAAPLTLCFDHPVGDKAPVLRWRLLEKRWHTLSDSLEIGDLRSQSDATGYRFGVPLKIKDARRINREVRLNLIDTEKNQHLAHSNVSFNPGRRGLAVGDAIWLGPLTISAQQVRALMGHTLVLTVMPLGPDPRQQNALRIERLRNTRRVYRPVYQHLVCYLRFFVDASGRLDVMLGDVTE